jgi:gliding motility-associated-like protein
LAYDGACASLPFTFKVIVNPVPVLEKVNDVNICSGTIVPAPIMKTIPSNVKYAYSIPQLGGNFIELTGNILNWIPIPKTTMLFKQDVIVMPLYKGCKGNPDTFNILVKPSPVSAFTYHINYPDTSFTTITYTLVNTGKGYNSFEWQLGSETDTSNLTKTISIATNKVFKATLLTTNEYGCTDQYSYNLPTERKPVIYIPNAFSPNLDGINDLFTVSSMGMQSWNIRIFNSWGEMVYAGNNTQGIWDGSYLNEPCQDGTYVWFTKAIDVSGESYAFKGTVLLNR